MGFVGNFAASWQTSARQLTACALILEALLGQACTIEQPVSGPVSLTGDWTTITPPEPLRVAGKLEQQLCLDVGLMRDVDFEKGVVVLDNGQRYTLAGEADDDQQRTYALKVGARSKALCMNRADLTPNVPHFPPARTIVRVRLRSDPPLRVAEIRWHSYDPH
jgi:hypothetical protein